jgi:hypothetical protein
VASAKQLEAHKKIARDYIDHVFNQLLESGDTHEQLILDAL